MKKIKNMDGYGIEGWVEVDDIGRIVTGRLGIKVYARRQDLIDEGFGHDEVAKAHVYVDVPEKIKSLMK